MRVARISKGGEQGLAVATKRGTRALVGTADPGTLDRLIAAGGDALRAAVDKVALSGEPVDAADIAFLPPLARPSKIICLGLNYLDHAAETGVEPPDFPTLFARFPSSLTGHGAPIILPRLSSRLDFEGELAVVIGQRCKGVAADRALDQVLGYSVFNDGSLRDYQRRTTQWTAGKNFDSTGGFGPWLVSADELPPGADGLRLETRLNGETMQSASTSQMIFKVAQTIAIVTSFLTLEPGDMLVMGTPAGVGAARKPPLFMKHGDRVEVEIEGIGLLANPVVGE